MIDILKRNSNKFLLFFIILIISIFSINLTFTKDMIDNTELHDNLIFTPDKDIEDNVLVYYFLNESQNKSYDYYSKMLPYYIFLNKSFNRYNVVLVNVQNNNYSEISYIDQAFVDNRLNSTRAKNAKFVMMGSYNIIYHINDNPDIIVNIYLFYCPTKKMINQFQFIEKVSAFNKASFATNNYMTVYDLAKTMSSKISEALNNYHPHQLVTNAGYDDDNINQLTKSIDSEYNISEKIKDEQMPKVVKTEKQKEKKYFHLGIMLGPNINSLHNSQTAWDLSFIFQPFIYFSYIDNLDLQFDISYKRNTYTYKDNSPLSIDIISFPVPVTFKPYINIKEPFGNKNTLKLYFLTGLRENIVLHKSNDYNTKENDLHIQIGFGSLYKLYDDVDFVFEYHYLIGLTNVIDNDSILPASKHRGHEFLFGLNLFDF